MPIEAHAALWLEGPKRLVTTSVYAAALVSLHGTRLVRAPRADALTSRTSSRSRRSSAAGSASRATSLEPGSTLVWIWDYLSLAALLGWEGEVEGLRVDGPSVTPWPFRSETLTVRCEARRLRERFSDEAAMQAALAARRPSRSR